VAAAQPSVFSPDNTAQVVQEIFKALAPQLKPDANLEQVTDSFKRAFETSLEMVRDSAKQNPSTTQANSPVALLQQMISLITPLMTQQRGPDILEQLGTLKSLGLLSNTQKGSGLADEIREALGERIADKILNPDGSGTGSSDDWKALLARGFSQMVEHIPAVLDKVVTLQRGAPVLEASGNPAGVRVPVAQPAPAPAAALPANHPAGMGATADVRTVDINMDELKSAALLQLGQVFTEGDSGQAAFTVLRYMAPQILPGLAKKIFDPPVFGSVNLVLGWLQEQPELADIKDDPDLKDFVREFIVELRAWDADQKADAAAAAEQAPAGAETQ
jgi:hypothetical protein